MTLQTMSFIFGALLLAVGILGGGFEVKEIKVSNVTTSARIAAAIAGIVFIVLGFWEPNLNPLAPAVSTGATKAPSATMAMGPREEDTDRFGSDYNRSPWRPAIPKPARTLAAARSGVSPGPTSNPVCRDPSRSAISRPWRRSPAATSAACRA